MARRKSVCVKWTVVLVLVLCSSFVLSRPQEPSAVTSTPEFEKPTETPISHENINDPETKSFQEPSLPSSSSDTSRNVKGKAPVIGESIKMVTNQLLEKPSNKTSEAPLVPDTRIPPKLKTQIAQKLKIKTRNEEGVEPEENSHAGIAVPVSAEELESENLGIANESSTTNEGISTWVLVSNPANKENSSVATEPTKIEDKKQKPNAVKNKNKRPQYNKNSAKRPIVGSTNKSDLVAGGSAINENVYNKLKDTVLSNVQKNKNISTRTTTTGTTVAMTSESPTIKREISTKSPLPVTTVVKAKVNKKNNKNKQKIATTTVEPIVESESAILPMEAKEQEIELEISTPATTTKKPKRSSTRKKTKTKKRKTTKPKQETTTAVATQVKTANKTKSTKLHKKPGATETGPFTTQIYNYFSREVMPSVGVGVIGLAGLLGIAGYFLYPFTGTPVRRTFEVDKKDDIYKHNAEEYANEGNGQPEEEMLGTVLAGMPVTTKEKYNPYSAQTTHINRYPTKKDQDIRYRHVTNSYGTTSKYGPKYNVHYQQKTGLAHGAVYPEPLNYQYQYESRHSYSSEKPPQASTYSPYSAVEPIYAAPQVGPSSYGSDSSSSVVYGVKPAEDSDFKPVYPYDSQYHSETTNNPLTYPPTSMYLGSNNENQPESQKYEETSSEDKSVDNKFVVGNVPKEFSESATPAVVPEHGPRKLRKRRNLRKKRSVVGSIEELLKTAKENKGSDIFISNEIEERLETPNNVFLASDVDNNFVVNPGNKDVYTVYAASADPKDTLSVIPNSEKNEVIESVSTIPIDVKNEKTELSNEIEKTTKAFKIYEVFNKTDESHKNDPLVNENENEDTTTNFKNVNTGTTIEIIFETTSTILPSTATETTSKKPKPTEGTDIITYPPPSSSGSGFFDFLKRLFEFKYRLGLSILQTTSDNLSRYLRSLENATKKSSKTH